MDSILRKRLIVSRYLKRQRSLTREALERLAEEAPPEGKRRSLREDEEEQKVERPLGLHEQRMGTVLSVLRGSGAKTVLDLGCGEGKLLRPALADAQFEKILGMDVSWRSIEIATDRLKLNQLPERQRARIELMQGSLMYRDKRLSGFDAAAVVEVIEHLDAARLAAFERVLFEFARPSCMVITTPNAEYNALFPTLPAGHFRHLVASPVKPTLGPPEVFERGPAMDTRRSFYLAPRQDDLADLPDAGWIDTTEIPSVTPANDNSRVKDRLSTRCATFLRRLIALHRLSRPN